MTNPLKTLKQYLVGDYLAQTENVFDRARIELMYTYTMLFALTVWPFQFALFSLGFHIQFYINIPAISLIFVLLWWLKNKKSVQWAGAIYAATQILNSALHGAVYNYAPSLQGFLWILIGVLVAFFVVGRWAGVVASIWLFVYVMFTIANKESGFAYFNAGLHPDKVMPETQFFVAVPLLFNLYLLWLVAKTNNLAQVKMNESHKLNEELLLNILPAETAAELKAKGKADAKFYDEVTVLFADIKSFSSIASETSPEVLVSELHECFKAFDEIISKHGIEKIKTIGDAYLCASGIPVKNADHAATMIKVAQEMLAAIQKRNAAKEGIHFEFRIGIHSGPIVAGVVGIKKFAYDIWGDTVNMASRMQQYGEPGMVNVSQFTYSLVKDKFRCTPRGKIEVKGKGEVEMFFVDTAV